MEGGTPPPLCLQPNCPAVAGWGAACDLPGDHHAGQVGGETTTGAGGRGAAPEDSGLQLVWSLFRGFHLQRCTLPEAGTCLLCALCHCVRSWAWTQTRPASSKAARAVSPPVPQRVGPGP